MNEKEHISKEDLLALQFDMLDQDNKVKILEHICTCDYCADQFASQMSDEIISAPRDMKANILRATRRPEVQLAVKARETSKRVQLIIYSLKVCTATVCALLLLLLTMNLSDVTSTMNLSGNAAASEVTYNKESNETLTSAIRNGVDKINNSMLDFSNSIMNKEVTDHDQKEK